MNAALEIVKLGKTFGGIRALENISLELAPGEIFGLIGPNGAGKSTLVNVLSGIYPASSGYMRVGNYIVPKRATVHHIARLGIARTFQTPQIFGAMTLLDNVMVGLTAKWPWWKTDRRQISTAYEYLQLLGLENYARFDAKALPYGKKRLLEMARALASHPKILLLDEPGAGMNPSELDELALRIRQIRDMGVAVLLIEHNMRLVLHVSKRLAVMVSGQIIFNGDPELAVADERVIASYLGERAVAWMQ